MEYVARHDSGGLCRLVLNRPDKLNALNTPAFESLDRHLAAIERETDRIGCVVVRGSGRGFCAGADLRAMDEPPVARSFKPGVIDRLSRLPQPVIAAVHGVCYTGGLELALACDLIIAETTARFADTHGRWGLVHAWGMAQRLSRRVGVPTAKRMMLTSAEMRADEAFDRGLVDLLAPEGQLSECVDDVAAAILANSWHTNFTAKRTLQETDGMSLRDALAYEQSHHPGRAADHKERVARFGRQAQRPAATAAAGLVPGHGQAPEPGKREDNLT